MWNVVVKGRKGETEVVVVRGGGGVWCLFSVVWYVAER